MHANNELDPRYKNLLNWVKKFKFLPKHPNDKPWHSMVILSETWIICNKVPTYLEWKIEKDGIFYRFSSFFDVPIPKIITKLAKFNRESLT